MTIHQTPRLTAPRILKLARFTPPPISVSSTLAAIYAGI